MVPAELSLLAGMFAAALAAGSILPMQSEAVLAGLLTTTSLSPTLLVAKATIGNVMGSVINWLLGRGIERFRDRRWFPASPEGIGRASVWYARYGRWTLLLSWVPIIGDPLTVVAGILKEPFWSFTILVTIAKCARYLAVWGAVVALI